MTIKKLSKKHVALTVLLAGSWLTHNANASVISGLYFGGQLGGSNINDEHNFVEYYVAHTNHYFKKSSSNSGFAWRAFGGYKINPIFAVESGYTHFHNTTAEASQLTRYGCMHADGTIRTYAVDVVGKAIASITNGFNVYGKLGGAYMHASADKHVPAIINNVLTMQRNTNTKTSNFYPTFGAGLSFDITRNFVTDFAWNRYQKVGSGSHNLPSANFIAGGLSYIFG